MAGEDARWHAERASELLAHGLDGRGLNDPRVDPKRVAALAQVHALTSLALSWLARESR